MPLYRKQIIIQVPSNIPELIKTIADASDYVSMVDNSEIPYKITKANLFAGLSSGSGSGGSTGGTSVYLTFASSGDNKGLFYFLGTQKNTVVWSNPSNNGLSIGASAVENGSVEQLCNRSGNDFWTPASPGGWVSFHITTGKLKCNYYSIKTREVNTDYYPRNWKLQGSNDNSTWVDLDIQVNNTALSSLGQWLSLPIAAVESYSYFRLLVTGVNSNGYYHLCLGEVELYGIYTP